MAKAGGKARSQLNLACDLLSVSRTFFAFRPKVPLN